MASSYGDAIFNYFCCFMEQPIIIRKKNPLKKAELPILVVCFFYLFIFYAMAGGQLGVMIQELFSLETGIIGLTFAIMGFGTSVLLNMLQISKVSLDEDALMARSRLGLGKRYDLNDLEKCFIRWYDTKGGRFPMIQFNFKGDRKLQLQGDQYQGLKPLILHLRDTLGTQLKEVK